MTDLQACPSPATNCELSEEDSHQHPQVGDYMGSSTSAEHPEIPLHFPLSDEKISLFLVKARSLAYSSHKTCTQQSQDTTLLGRLQATHTLTLPSSLRKGNTAAAWQPYPQHPALLPGVKDIR